VASAGPTGSIETGRTAAAIGVGLFGGVGAGAGPEAGGQRLQLRTRLDVELAPQRHLGVAIGKKRLRASSGPGQGQHEARPETFAIGRLADRPPQLGGQGLVLAKLQAERHELVDRGRPQLFEPGELGRCHGFVADVGDARSAPDRHGLGQHRDRGARVPAG